MSDNPDAVEDWSVDEFLDGITPVTRSVSVCMRGDLFARIDQLTEELQKASENDSGSLATGTRRLAEEIEQVRQEAAAHSRTFVVAAIGDEAWSTLKADNKASKDEQADGKRFNDDFAPKAVAAACRTPKVSEKQARLLRERLSATQWAELFGAVVMANEGDARVPKAGLASAILRRFAHNSPTADPGESPAASS